MNWLKKVFGKFYRSDVATAASSLWGRFSWKSARITASVPCVGDFDFYIHSRRDLYISGDLRRDGIWEPFETEVFRRLCKTGDYVLDIGANIGWYSVIAAHLVGRSGRICSVEPDPVNFRLLKRNVSTSGNAGVTTMLNVALGDSKANSKFFLSERNLGDHRLFDDGESRDFVEVKVTTLDALFADTPSQPTLVKSDTQGSEACILRGARSLLAEGWRPIFILEFWPYGLTSSGDDPVDLWQSLIALGYEIYELSEATPRLVPLAEERLFARIASDISPQSQGYINLLCLPLGSDRLGLVKDLIVEITK